MAPNGTRIFVAEQSPLDSVSSDVYLGVAHDGIGPADKIDVVFGWTATHWGTQVMTVRDPDGRLFRLEAPAEASER